MYLKKKFQGKERWSRKKKEREEAESKTTLTFFFVVQYEEMKCITGVVSFLFYIKTGQVEPGLLPLFQ